MKIFTVSLGIFLITVSFGMESTPGQPVELEATTEQRPLEKNERQFWIPTAEDSRKYLTALGMGVVTKTSFQHPGQCFYRYTPYVKNENGEIELSNVNEYVEDLFFEHKQIYHGGRIAFLGEDYKRYFHMSDYLTATIVTKEKGCMSLEDVLRGLKFQLKEIGHIMKNVIPKRKEILYTDPNIDKHPDTPAIEREFSSETHKNREDSIVAKIGVVYPFDECLERLYLGLKEIGHLMSPTVTPQTNPPVASQATPPVNPSANLSEPLRVTPSVNSLREIVRNLRKESPDTEETTE